MENSQEKKRRAQIKVHNFNSLDTQPPAIEQDGVDAQNFYIRQIINSKEHSKIDQYDGTGDEGNVGDYESDKQKTHDPLGNQEEHVNSPLIENNVSKTEPSESSQEMTYEQFKDFKRTGNPIDKRNQKSRKNNLMQKSQDSIKTHHGGTQVNLKMSSRKDLVQKMNIMSRHTGSEKSIDNKIFPSQYGAMSEDKPVTPADYSMNPVQKDQYKQIINISGTAEVQPNTAKIVQYKSRGNEHYSDTESMDNTEDSASEEEEPMLTPSSRVDSLKKNPKKNAINFLKAQEQILMQQVTKNRQLLEVEKQKAALGANADSEVKPNPRFKNFNEVFSSLTLTKNVPTLFPIVSCIITYNSKSVITVTKKSETESLIKQYSLDSYLMNFEERVFGNYIKLKEVEQNSSGEKFAVVFLDDGIFKLRTFGDKTRSSEEIQENEVNLNEMLEINNFTMPIQNFPDPFITCTFVNDNLIFINLFHNHSLTHHHLFFHIEERKITGYTKVKMDSNLKNFPYKCFYNSDLNEVYSFYRQCQSFRIPCRDNPHHMNKNWKADYKFDFEQIYDRDLGTMYLVNNTALIARCSSQILLFKIKIDEFTKEKTWFNYQKLDLRGFLYFIKGNKRIQITTDHQIYFYLIDPVTYEATIENVMFNFMNCSNMMFGSKVRYCVTYKTNQKSFDVYRRKYEHDFRVNAIDHNYDGCIGLPVETMNAFLVSDVDVVNFYDVDSFKEIEECRIQIPLLKSDTREPNQIISMQISQNEDILAVISGKNLIMNQQFPNQLFIFRRMRTVNTDMQEMFILQKRIMLKDSPIFQSICMQFLFKLTKFERDPTIIFFAKQDRLLELNFETDEIRTIVEFEVPLSKQPEFFLMNDDQSVSLIASQDDGIYLNHRTKQFLDIDELYQISNIKEIIHDHEEKMFYILCNKYRQKLGIFLIRMNEKDPKDHIFILRWKNKLDIADANINIIRNVKQKFKELVISFKTIYINTFNVQVIDISSEEDQPTLFRHESFQLWESKISGFYLNKNKDFVTVNREGINFLSLNFLDKRTIQNRKGQDKMVHSLGSTNYLKVDQRNFILFEFATDIKVISIMQQYTTENAKTGEETNFEVIYKIRIHDITLRELLLFQSLYVCKTQSDILRLVESQPNPSVFYKSFLELDCTNMVSILAFDSRSLQLLLEDKNNQFFQTDYPIFYKNKITKSNNTSKYFYRSPVNSALRNNQIRAVGYIIDYVCKYQNRYVSSYMFAKVTPTIINKGIEVTKLFNSQIFCFQFDYDEWPTTHSNQTSYMRPYNGSIFDLRQNYRTIFPEEKFSEDYTNKEASQDDQSKIYKIRYSINMLSMIEKYAVRKNDGSIQYENEDVSLMTVTYESDELEIFESENLVNLIRYKWDTFAQRLHMRGAIMHFIYLVVMMIYIKNIYIDNQYEDQGFYSILLCVGVVYPTWYDMLQLYKVGPKEYFSDPGNYSDLIYTWGSLINVYLQNFSDPQNFSNKVIMVILLLQQLIKSFFFMRIFDKLSYIVTMIYKVMKDLMVFMLFFFMLMVIFGMIFAVIGIGNTAIPGGFQDHAAEIEKHNLEQKDVIELAGGEYDYLGLFLGYIILVLRMSLGDFDFEASEYLNKEENILFWIIWLLVVLITCIVFLNFIIAEASDSYSKIKLRLDAFVNKEKSVLISEAEDMTFDRYKDDKMFPKYIIIREIET